MASVAAKQLVHQLINTNKVVVFSKTYCPFCMLAKSVLKEAGVGDFKVLELEERTDGMQIQNVLKELTGNPTVPSVFIDKKFIGGGTDVQRKFEEGELTQILRESQIID